MADNEQLKALYLDAEHEDNYFRDQSVFSDGITIEDTMSVLVKYQNNVQLTYSLNAYLPWEGLNVVFNGTEGRLEMKIVEKSYYKGFPEQSTPVFNFCLFINERQGIRLRYYKRSC